MASYASTWAICFESWRSRRQKECQIEEGHLIARSRSHHALDTAQVRGGSGDRVHQGEERDSYRAGVPGSAPELRGPALLGTRVLRLDRRARRSSGSRIHPASGEGGQKARPTSPALGKGLPERAARSTAALSGSHSPKPPALPGDVLLGPQCFERGLPNSARRSVLYGEGWHRGPGGLSRFCCSIAPRIPRSIRHCRPSVRACPRPSRIPDRRSSQAR